MKPSIKVVIAPDSFKGSIAAEGAARAIARGLSRAARDRVELVPVLCPIADGGEGTLDALALADGLRHLTVTGPDGKPVKAAFGMKNGTAIVEMASAAGLTLVVPERRSAETATTYGVGELITAALDAGARRILLTVGGSATNDGGAGMLAALGARFFDKSGHPYVPKGGTLSEIGSFDMGGLDPRLFETEFRIATDVKNPLVGENGATYVYGRQKGADDAALACMEAGMRHYATLLCDISGRDVAGVEGAGAGGGLAAPLLAFCNATVTSGIHAVLDTVGFDALLEGADLVLTGEGKIDEQSLCGKAISGVAEAAGRKNIPVAALVGCIGGDRDAIMAMGLCALVATADIAPSTAYSMAHADELLDKIAYRYFTEFLDGKLFERH